MSKEDTKRHFAEICETIWSKIEHQERLEKATAEKMRQIVANMAMIAWNMCLIHKSADETKKALRRLAEEKYDGSPCALTPLMDTAELKWLDYRDDHELISKVEVKTVDGKPKAVAYLKGECPEVSSKFAEFHAFLNSPEIQERLRHTSPDKLEEVLLSPDTLMQLAQNLKDEQEKRKALQEQVEAQRPAVLFTGAVETSKTSILIGELAKILKQNGVNIGPNRLFEWMRQNGYLIKRKGTDYNMPTQRSMEMGLFEIKETAINNPDGSIRISKTPKVTGKGQVYFINYFLSKEEKPCQNSES